MAFISERMPPIDPTTNERARDVAFYMDEDPKIEPEARSLLQDYSLIPSEQVESHVRAIRDRAWNVFPYPCIGLYRFMSLGLYRLPSYPEVVERLKSGAVFLDLGCCFGQEIRDLVRAGVPSKSLYGSDLRQEFWDLGYELFKDKETLESTFYAADIFDESETSPLRQLEGKVDILYAGSFFHLFSWDQQLQVAKRVVGMLKPAKGSMLVGKQMGRKIGGAAPLWLRPGATESSVRTIWKHDGESWEKMWKETGEATGTEWGCKTTVEEFTAQELGSLGRDSRIGSALKDAEVSKISFVVERL